MRRIWIPFLLSLLVLVKSLQVGHVEVVAPLLGGGMPWSDEWKNAHVGSAIGSFVNLNGTRVGIIGAARKNGGVGTAYAVSVDSNWQSRVLLEFNASSSSVGFFGSAVSSWFSLISDGWVLVGRPGAGESGEVHVFQFVLDKSSGTLTKRAVQVWADGKGGIPAHKLCPFGSCTYGPSFGSSFSDVMDVSGSGFEDQVFVGMPTLDDGPYAGGLVLIEILLGGWAFEVTTLGAAHFQCGNLPCVGVGELMNGPAILKGNKKSTSFDLFLSTSLDSIVAVRFQGASVQKVVTVTSSYDTPTSLSGLGDIDRDGSRREFCFSAKSSGLHCVSISQSLRITKSWSIDEDHGFPSYLLSEEESLGINLKGPLARGFFDLGETDVLAIGQPSLSLASYDNEKWFAKGGMLLVQLDCPSGMERKGSDCEKCLGGTSRNTNMFPPPSQCIQCPPGTYAPPGASICFPCALLSTSPARSSACSLISIQIVIPSVITFAAAFVMGLFAWKRRRMKGWAWGVSILCIVTASALHVKQIGRYTSAFPRSQFGAAMSSVRDGLVLVGSPQYGDGRGRVDLLRIEEDGGSLDLVSSLSPDWLDADENFGLALSDWFFLPNSLNISALVCSSQYTYFTSFSQTGSIVACTRLQSAPQPAGKGCAALRHAPMFSPLSFIETRPNMTESGGIIVLLLNSSGSLLNETVLSGEIAPVENFGKAIGFWTFNTLTDSVFHLYIGHGFHRNGLIRITVDPSTFSYDGVRFIGLESGAYDGNIYKFADGGRAFSSFPTLPPGNSYYSNITFLVGAPDDVFLKDDEKLLGAGSVSACTVGDSETNDALCLSSFYMGKELPELEAGSQFGSSLTTWFSDSSKDGAVYTLVGATGHPPSTQEGTVFVIKAIGCGPGRFLSMGAACRKCYTGRYSQVISFQNCKACAAGSFSGNHGAVNCTLCAPGTYQDEQEARWCKPCHRGTAEPSHGSTTNCTYCEPGTYAGKASPHCLKCSPGSYQDERGSRECKECAPGSALNEHGATSPCPWCKAGSASKGGVANCTVCRAGSYSLHNASTSCTICSPGTFSAVVGAATNCTKCSIGKHATNAGSTSCTNCGPGTIADKRGAINCSTCAAGRWAGGGGGVCTECEKGQYQPSSGASSCQDCEAGTYAPSRSMTMCKECPAGRASSKEAAKSESTCEFCKPGTYQRFPGEVECDMCSPGYASNITGSTKCSSCPAGYFSQRGSTHCDICPQGKYSGKSFGGCLDCPAGTWSNLSGAAFVSACVPCAPGFASRSGSLLCHQCNPGFYANLRRTSCQTCPKNTHNRRTGLDSPLGCIPCPPASNTPAGSAACSSQPPTFAMLALPVTSLVACATSTFVFFLRAPTLSAPTIPSESTPLVASK